jgi:RNA polymerase sigma-70 factor (ECF subfamily)
MSLSRMQSTMTVVQTASDEDLYRRMLAGDEDAFAALYRRHQGNIYRFALQMSGSEAVAEDVTQEVFLAVIREAINFDESRGSLAGYLYGIARNQVLRRFKRDSPYVAIADDAEDGEVGPADWPVAGGDPLGDLTRSEEIESVRQAIVALPAHYREVVVLCDLHEMSYAEAAEVLGCAVGTVRSRLHRARALLVEKLRARGKAGVAFPGVSSARCFA